MKVRTVEKSIRISAWLWLLVSVLLFLCAQQGHAQGLRYDSVANSTASVAGLTVTTPLPGATVTVCSVPVIAAAPTGASESSNVVTITTTVAHGLTAGQSVIIQDVAVAGYNGTFTIATVPTTTSFTYINGTTGLGTSGGGVVIPNSKPCVNTATIYSDPGLQTATSNPITADSQGNFGFWAAANAYVYTITGTGLTSAGPFYVTLGSSTGSTVTLPAGSLFTCRWENVRIIDENNTCGWAGSDIGAWIAAAYADMPATGGTALVVQKANGTCYSMTTTVTANVIGKPISITGLAPGTLGNVGKTAQTGTCINFTPTTAVFAFIFDWGSASGDTSYAGTGGLYNIQLINNQCVAAGGCGSLASGVENGGTNGGVRGLVLRDVSIMGFANAKVNADANGVGWGTDWTGGSCAFNLVCNSYQSTVNENDTYVAVDMVNNGNNFQTLAGKFAEFTVIGSSMDSGTSCGISNAGTTYAELDGVHQENLGQLGNIQYSCDSSSGLHLTINGGSARDDGTGSSSQNWFSAAGTTVSGLLISTARSSFTGKIFNVGDVSDIAVWNNSPSVISSAKLCNFSVPCYVRNINHNGGEISALPPITGSNTHLPAATQFNLYMAGNIGTPIVGRLYAGDGSGFQLNIAKRTASVDTDLFLFKDSGNFSMAGGLLDNYNKIATVSNGVPSEYATVDLTAQTAAITTTTLYAVPSTGAGQYRLSWNAKVTTAAGTSSTLGALTVTYTDPDGTVQTITAGAQSTAGAIETTDAGNTTNTKMIGLPMMLNCKASTNIQYAFAYASNAASAMNYNLHLKLEAQ